MKNKLRAIIALALLCAFQNFSNANTAYVHDDAYNYLAYDCSRIIAFNNNYSDNIFTTPDIGFTFVDVDGEMSISKVIDDDFSLEMDLDVNSKKQIRPKARVIEGQKIDTKTPKFVEKVMIPHLKKHKIKDEIVEDKYDNLDIDQVADVDGLVKKQKQDKKERLAKAKSHKERLGWFNFFRRGKTTTVAADNKSKKANDSGWVALNNTEKLADNSEFDIDRDNLQSPALIKKEKVKKTKPHTIKTEKPVKVAKVVEPKPVKVKPQKAEKIAKVSEPKVEKVKTEKPIKIAKVVEPKPVKVKPQKAEKIAKVSEPKVEKVKTEEPIKVAKVVEPKPVKVKPQKVEKVAQVSEPKVEKVKTEKPIKVAKVVEPKPVKVKPQKVEKVANVSEPKVEKVKTEKPVKVAKVVEPKPVKVKPQKAEKVANVSEPKVEKVKTEKPIKVAKVVEPKPVKVKPQKVEKVANVSEPKVEKVKTEKPIKIAKVVEPKPVKVKPQKVEKVATPTTAITTNRAYSNNMISISSIMTSSKNQPLSIMNIDTSHSFVHTERKEHSKVKPQKVEKIAKVSEPKVEKVKTEKPVKIAKVVEPKPIKVKPQKAEKVAKVSEPKVEKVKTEKPVKVAKMVEPKPVKVKPQKVEKVAKVSEPKVEKVKTEKPVKVAKVVEPKPVKVKPQKVEKIAVVNDRKNEIVAKSINNALKPTRVETQKPVSIFTPVKVAPKSLGFVKVEDKELALKTNEVKSGGFTPLKIKPKALSVTPAKLAEQQTKQTVQFKSATPSEIDEIAKNEYKPVGNIESENVTYKAFLKQETPVYTAFEQVQERLPITRKAFDNE